MTKKVETEKELNLESKIRKETINELIEYLEDCAWRQELCTYSIPAKRKKDQDAAINRDKGFRDAIKLLKYCFTEDGTFADRKFVAGK